MPRTSRSLSASPGDRSGEAQAGSSATQPRAVTASAQAPLAASQLDEQQLQSVVESLLFVAGRPLEMSELRRLLALDEMRLRAAVAGLAEECERAGRGIRVQRLGESVQIVSAPENARFVAALLGLPTQVKLTTAALETLAVVAYRQPITRSQIEFIRGVNSDRALASLVQYGLVSEVGRAATVGRPVLFGTTPEFLQQFGLSSLEALPSPQVPEAETAEALRKAAAEQIRTAVGKDDEPTPSAS